MKNKIIHNICDFYGITKEMAFDPELGAAKNPCKVLFIYLCRGLDGDGITKASKFIGQHSGFAYDCKIIKEKMKQSGLPIEEHLNLIRENIVHGTTHRRERFKYSPKVGTPLGTVFEKRQDPFLRKRKHGQNSVVKGDKVDYHTPCYKTETVTEHNGFRKFYYIDRGN